MAGGAYRQVRLLAGGAYRQVRHAPSAVEQLERRLLEHLGDAPFHRRRGRDAPGFDSGNLDLLGAHLFRELQLGQPLQRSPCP